MQKRSARKSRCTVGVISDLLNIWSIDLIYSHSAVSLADSVCLSVCLSACLSVNPSSCLSSYVPVRLPAFLSVRQPICQPASPQCLAVHLYLCLFDRPSHILPSDFVHRSVHAFLTSDGVPSCGIEYARSLRCVSKMKVFRLDFEAVGHPVLPNDAQFQRRRVALRS